MSAACHDHPVRGYTPGMKTAVSVPDDVFERADRLARQAGRSRSDVYSAALREYVARHAPDEVTEALDSLVGEIGEGVDPFVAEAARRSLGATDW
jgi:alkanesulfonate monooxygenase SsuD/methylene tetrahydromethanopterin reductase-like flavin-dependent oxidoreductase (luciferase family)